MDITFLVGQIVYASLSAHTGRLDAPLAVVVGTLYQIEGGVQDFTVSTGYGRIHFSADDILDVSEPDDDDQSGRWHIRITA